MSRSHTRWYRGFFALLVTVVGLAFAVQAATPQPVFAHAAYVGSDPGADSVVLTSPTQVSAWFSEPMAPTASSIEVLDTLGRRVDMNDSKVDPDDLLRMSVSVNTLPNGTYTVSWRNVSTVDGHGISGSFLFYVGSRPAAATSSEAADPPLLQSRADPVVRWVALLGALAVVGGLLFEPAILRPAVTRSGRRNEDQAIEATARGSRRGIRKLVWGGLAVLLLGSLGQLLIQAGITADVDAVFSRPW